MALVVRIRAAASSIIGVNTRMPCATPITLTPSTQSQSATVFSQIRPPAPTPALLKTMFGAPKRAFVAAPSASTSAALRDVEPKRQHLGAHRPDLGGGAIERVLLDVGHDDVHAPLRGDARGLEAEPRCRARDDGGAAGEVSSCAVLPDRLDVITDARKVHVHAAGARIDASDHDLVAVEPDERAGDLVVRVVGGGDGDRVAGREALPGATAVVARARSRALRSRSLLPLPSGSASPWPNAATRSNQRAASGTATSSAAIGGARRMNQIDCAAEKSAIEARAPSRNGRPSPSMRLDPRQVGRERGAGIGGGARRIVGFIAARSAPKRFQEFGRRAGEEVRRAGGLQRVRHRGPEQRRVGPLRDDLGQPALSAG